MKGSGARSKNSSRRTLSVTFDRESDNLFPVHADQHGACSHETMDAASDQDQKAKYSGKTSVPATPRCTSPGYLERADQILSYPNALNSEFLSTLISKEFFKRHFPDSRYEYEALMDAAHSYPKPRFGLPIDVARMKREIAAFLAHIDHATNGLSNIDNDTPKIPHCKTSIEYPCVKGASYHPRGPMKMCWNYNYGQCGVAIGENLLKYPERVAEDPVVAFKSALWFWCTEQWNKPSCHEVMLGLWEPTEDDIAAQRLPGFGLTTNIINGGQECGQSSVEADSRLRRYQKFCTAFSVEPGQNLSTRNQTPFA